MSIPAPHFLLFSDSKSSRRQGDWRFVLQSVDGAEKLEVEDAEPEVRGERLELLAVVRGLEALEQPSRVTLITASKYVSRGLTDGLQDWRENNWQWENHGTMVPIKNRDLWQRLARALAFHRLDCRSWRVDAAEPNSKQFSAGGAKTESTPTTVVRANAVDGEMAGDLAPDEAVMVGRAPPRGRGARDDFQPFVARTTTENRPQRPTSAAARKRRWPL